VIARMNVGGPAWQVSVLQRHLGYPEFKSTLVCGRVSSGEKDFIELRAPDLPHVEVPTLGRSVRLVGDVITFVRLLALFRKTRPDIVHTHTAKAGVVGRLAAVAARVPVRVHTFHGHLLKGYFSPQLTRVVVLVERFLARRTTALVAVGSQVRDDLLVVGIGRPEQFTVIPPGVERPRPVDVSMARQQLGLGAGDEVIVFVGRLTAIKRPDRLIEAFRLVLEQQSSAVLLVVGDGELLDVTRESARDLGDRVRFAGWQADLAPYYAAADEVVLTSDNEGMPVSLIEASMAGRPCVTTDVGSAREVVDSGRTGLVVATNAEAVADALLSLLSDRGLRESMGAAAREHAERNFGDERLAEDHRRLYRRLMGRPEIESGA
jgi:glycosyltransferase involved in cell wall biosynthesis